MTCIVAVPVEEAIVAVFVATHLYCTLFSNIELLSNTKLAESDADVSSTPSTTLFHEKVGGGKPLAVHVYVVVEAIDTVCSSATSTSFSVILTLPTGTKKKYFI